MVFRKFGIWVVKNLIILLLVTFIFSTVALDLPNMVGGIFKDVFRYASPEAQNETVGKLTMACSALDGKDVSELKQAAGMPFDLSKIGSLCMDYNSKKINGQEFFFSVIGSAIPEKLELPNTGALEKYISVVNALNKNRIIYFIVLAVLLGILYLLAWDIELFIATLSGISFGIGAMILIPYAAIMAYSKFVGIDTTPILSTIFSGSFSFDAKAIISVVLLMILRTYSSFIVALGVIFLSAGILGKVHGFMSKRRGKSAEAKPEEKSDKKAKEKIPDKEKPAKEKQTKDEEDEAYRHRDRSTKEILDELEEIHKKKPKKD
ncbi:hypothetical protein HYX08_05245 [Candidatus Woesearchaeota archaeon]|nr:hypothetical protein [Candidatus Woesearchaeota archaeon]